MPVRSIGGVISSSSIKTPEPVVIPDGVITAGISSPLNAGATCMLLMSKDEAKKKGITPIAKIRSIGFAGVDPTLMGTGPVPASQKALQAAGLEVTAIRDVTPIPHNGCRPPKRRRV